MAEFQWSPISPLVFCTGSSSGVIGVWDLSEDFEENMSNIYVADKLNALQLSDKGQLLTVDSSNQIEVLHMIDWFLYSSDKKGDL